MRKLTIGEFKSRLRPHLLVDENTYINTVVKCRFLDLDYGEFWARPNDVLNGKDHPIRGIVKQKESSTHSVVSIIRRLAIRLDIILDIETYKNTNTKCRFLDVEFGEFWVKPLKILQGGKHRLRANRENSLSKTRPVESVQEQLSDRPHITIKKETYVDTHTKCIFIDSLYGEYPAIPYNVIGNRAEHPKRSMQGISRTEKELAGFVKQYVDIVENYRFVENKKYIYSVDIFIPSKNLAIEYDGLYWHSEQQKHKKYHIEKRQYLESKGIHVLFIREDEWRDKTAIVKSIILTKLSKTTNKYFARQTKIVKVANKDATIFLSQNHLMGQHKSSKYIGLEYKGELVSIIGYKKYKTGVDISRFCNKLDSTIVGGLSKLLKEVEKLNQAADFIQSWVDRRYGTGDSLLTVGFKQKQTTLGWHWTDNVNTFNRLKCRANLDKRGLSEKEYAREFLWYKIFDAGQTLFLRPIKQL